MFRQAIALCADLHLGEMFATNTMNLAEVRLRLDDPRQACVFLRTALGEASRIGSVPLLLFGVIVYAQVLIHQGDTERACHLVSVLEHHPSRELVEDELERLRQRLPDIPSSRSVPTGNETDVSSFEDIVRGIIAGTVSAV